MQMATDCSRALLIIHRWLMVNCLRLGPLFVQYHIVEDVRSSSDVSPSRNLLTQSRQVPFTTALSPRAAHI